MANINGETSYATTDATWTTVGDFPAGTYRLVVINPDGAAAGYASTNTADTLYSKYIPAGPADISIDTKGIGGTLSIKRAGTTDMSGVKVHVVR